METVELYYHRKYLWHKVAIRVVVLIVPALLGRILETITKSLEWLCGFLDDKLPSPYITEKVPYDKLSKKEKRKPHKVIIKTK